MNGWHLCAAVLLGSLRQRVQADVDRLWLGTTLGRTGLDENVGMLLLCIWECVCVLSIRMYESRIVNAIVWV